MLYSSEEQKQQKEFLAYTINGFYFEKAKGAQIRARIDYIERKTKKTYVFSKLSKTPGKPTRI